MAGSNDETLRSYAARVQEYVLGTSQTVSGPSKDWIDRALAGLPGSARVMELGSAFGRDAAYMASLGYDVECTDAVDGFVALLQSRGFRARSFNALTDELAGPYDLVMANAVLLHFTADELAVVLERLRRALAPGGRLAFSLKAGEGEEWSSAKLAAPRYFRYWEQDGVAALLRAAGFAGWQAWEAVTDRAHARWLYVIALGD
ncbi:MAG TPA: methyltransferase domain-containing protein [Candidatus Sulfotelmatobacter sp.]|jgi:SAM-dependent methyltransferase|nr:methyltransferase domain-containing protein [Candidatus Sulfotelmatobacter sp.]